MQSFCWTVKVRKTSPFHHTRLSMIKAAQKLLPVAQEVCISVMSVVMLQGVEAVYDTLIYIIPKTNQLLAALRAHSVTIYGLQLTSFTPDPVGNAAPVPGAVPPKPMPLPLPVPQPNGTASSNSNRQSGSGASVCACTLHSCQIITGTRLICQHAPGQAYARCFRTWHHRCEPEHRGGF